MVYVEHGCALTSVVYIIIFESLILGLHGSSVSLAPALLRLFNKRQWKLFSIKTIIRYIRHRNVILLKDEKDLQETEEKMKRINRSHARCRFRIEDHV